MAWSHIEGLEERVGTSMSSIGHLVSAVHLLSSIICTQLPLESLDQIPESFRQDAWLELHKLWARLDTPWYSRSIHWQVSGSPPQKTIPHLLPLLPPPWPVTSDLSFSRAAESRRDATQHRAGRGWQPPSERGGLFTCQEYMSVSGLRLVMGGRCSSGNPETCSAPLLFPDDIDSRHSRNNNCRYGRKGMS